MTAARTSSSPIDRPSLNPSALVEYARFLAHEVRSGRYPYVEYDAAERWHHRIYCDDRVDAWLISWLPTQGTALHDHGGSAGAFSVIAGELAEAVHVPTGRGAGTLTERRHVAGQTVGFDAHRVHDVRNISPRPAVSVHTYSRPLTSMTFYDLDLHGALAPLVTVPTVDPEPDVDQRSSR